MPILQEFLYLKPDDIIYTSWSPAVLEAGVSVRCHPDLIPIGVFPFSPQGFIKYYPRQCLSDDLIYEGTRPIHSIC